MKPVTQTTFGADHGNCYGAAIASILEVPLEALPDYMGEYKAGRDWHGLLSAYLYRHHGVMLMEVDRRLTPFVQPKGWHLLNGMGPRDLPHSTVGRDGELVFDPHPDRTGLVKVESYEFLVPVNLDAIEDPEHRAGMESWLMRRECGCPECVVAERPA